MLSKFVLSSIFLALFPLTTYADTMHENSSKKDVQHFLLPTSVMDSKLFLAGPPSQDSALFAYDKELYQQGKMLRNTERGKQAQMEADVSTENLLKVFSKPFGYQLSVKDTPAIAYLVANMKEDAGGFATSTAKKYFKRERPYSYYKESPCNIEDTKHLNAFQSYPSGHTAIGWSVALVLSEINPDNQLDIIRKGYDIGNSRVICGYHWNSDVTDGRLIGAAVVARLHANDEFNDAMQKAKAEFKELSKKNNQKK